MMKSLLIPVVLAITLSIQAYSLMQMNDIQNRLQQINELLPLANIKVLKAEPLPHATDGLNKSLPAGETCRESVRM